MDSFGIPTSLHPTSTISKAFGTEGPKSDLRTPQNFLETRVSAPVVPRPRVEEPKRGLSQEEMESIEELVRKKSHSEDFPEFALKVEMFSFNLLSAVRLAQRPPITRDHLVNHRVTVEELVGVCGVSMMNLKLAGVVCDYRDLVRLNFKPSDVKINTKLFSINHLRMLCDDEMNVAKGRFGGMPTICNLIFSRDWERSLATSYEVCAGLARVKFSAAELADLGFSFSECFPQKMSPALTRETFEQLGLNETECSSLGLTRRMMGKLKLDFEFCCRRLKWNMEAAARIWNIEIWKQGRNQ